MPRVDTIFIDKLGTDIDKLEILERGDDTAIVETVDNLSDGFNDIFDGAMSTSGFVAVIKKKVNGYGYVVGYGWIRQGVNNKPDFSGLSYVDYEDQIEAFAVYNRIKDLSEHILSFVDKHLL